MNWFRVLLYTLCSYRCKQCGEPVNLRLLSASRFVVLETDCYKCGRASAKLFKRFPRLYRRLLKGLLYFFGFSLAAAGIWLYAVLVLCGGE